MLSSNDLPESYRPKENTPKDVNNFILIMKSDGWQLKHIAELLEKGEVKPIVDSVWKFEEFGEAFVKVESGHTRGKVIIEVQE